MLRELNRDEICFVSGGDDDGEGGIIVNGVRERSGDAASRIGGSEMGTVFLGGTGQYLACLADGPLVDTDEDGVPDSPSIVVNALTPSQVAAANQFADDGVNLLLGSFAIGTGLSYVSIGALESALIGAFGNAAINQAILNLARLVGGTIAINQLRGILYEAAAIELSNGTFYRPPSLGDWDYTGPVPGRINH